MQHRRRLICFLMVIMFLLYSWIGMTGIHSQDMLVYIALVIPLFGLYGIFVILSIVCPEKLRFPLGYILLSGLLFRIVLIPASPALSDDIYRYLWDGKISLAGINPYQYPPAAEELDSYRDSEIYPSIRYPEIKSVYPPVAQLIFFLNAAVGNTPLSWKMLLLLSEILLVMVMIKLIDYFQIPRLRLGIFVLNPLLIIETYYSGHLDMIGILFLMTGIWYFYLNRKNKSVFFLCLAVLTKFLSGLIILPMFLKKFWKKSFVVLIIVIVAVLPFSMNGSIPVGGIISYINLPVFNGGFHNLVAAGLNLVGIRQQVLLNLNINGYTEYFYIGPDFYYRIIALFVMIFVISDQLRKLHRTSDFQGINYLQTVFVIACALLLIMPGFKPWHLIWILPLLVFIPNWSWILFTLLVQASYIPLIEFTGSSTREIADHIWLLEYFPFYGLLLWEYVDRKKVKGWLTERNESGN